MGSDIHHFFPGPNGGVRILSRYEDDTGRVGHSQSDVAPQPKIAGLPWQQFIDAGSGIIVQADDGTVSIRPAPELTEDTPALAVLSVEVQTLNRKRGPQ